MGVETKLELKHLAPYLRHKLKMIFEGKRGRIIELSCLSFNSLGETFSDGRGGMWIDRSGFKPILRPLSDLTKEIHHDCKYFIPLIEIFEICAGGYYSIDNVLIEINNKVYKISTSIDELRFDTEDKYFIMECLDLEGNNWLKPFNQLELFEKLFEWHFDIFGLIEKGLAIDINTLKQ